MSGLDFKIKTSIEADKKQLKTTVFNRKNTAHISLLRGRVYFYLKSDEEFPNVCAGCCVERRKKKQNIYNRDIPLKGRYRIYVLE